MPLCLLLMIIDLGFAMAIDKDEKAVSPTLYLCANVSPCWIVWSLSSLSFLPLQQ